MLVKCKICGNKIDRKCAFKVIVNEKNNYYCTEEEYNEWKSNKDIKDSIYEVIFNIFGHKTINTILYKEINEIGNLYGYKNILNYINDNKNYLYSVMQKEFKSEYAKIRYFSAILKNNISDYTKKLPPEVIKKVEADIPKDNFKPRKRKKCISEFENEMGDEL